MPSARGRACSHAQAPLRSMLHSPRLRPSAAHPNVCRSHANQNVDVARQIGNAELAELPLRAWEGPVQLVESIANAEDAIRLLMSEELTGFDVECRPAFVRGDVHPPAVVQVAVTSSVFVFHLHRFKQAAVPRLSKYAGLSKTEASLEPLRPLITSSSVLKSGVGVLDDAKLIQKFAHDMEPRGFVDLLRIAKQLQFKTVGLRALAGLLLGFRLSKGQQMSDWERATLTPAQKKYAATDAWVSRELHLRLAAMLLRAQPAMRHLTQGFVPPGTFAHALALKAGVVDEATFVATTCSDPLACPTCSAPLTKPEGDGDSGFWECSPGCTAARCPALASLRLSKPKAVDRYVAAVEEAVARSVRRKLERAQRDQGQGKKKDRGRKVPN